MKQSKQFSINWRDVAHGLILAVGTPIALEIGRQLQAGKMDFSFKSLAMIGGAAGFTYISKKFLEKPTV